MCSFVAFLRTRIIAFVITLALLVSLSACSEKASPKEALECFCKEYGLSGDILSPSYREGDAGHIDESFFEYVFLESSDSVSDYAVIFLSTLDRISECSVFLCYSEYDAILVIEMLWRRVDFLKSSAIGMDISNLSDAVVFKSGKYAVMCALPDNASAERIWRKIL